LALTQNPKKSLKFFYFLWHYSFKNTQIHYRYTLPSLKSHEIGYLHILGENKRGSNKRIFKGFLESFKKGGGKKGLFIKREENVQNFGPKKMEIKRRNK